MLAMVSWAKSTHAASSKKLVCGKKELTLKNCQLEFKNYKISIWKDKFSVTDGISRSLTDLPLIHDKTEWDTVRFSQIGKLYLLEFIAWQEPDPTDIQTKKWYVYEIKAEKAELKLDKPLFKRLLIKGPGDMTSAKTDKAKKFGLKLKNQKVEWFLDREKGHLE